MSSACPEAIPSHLLCSVCLQQLKDPRVLPCLHSFCYECIVKQITGSESSSNCPLCTSFTQAVGDPSSLPPNYFANNLLATLILSTSSETKGFTCDNCDVGDLAETRCNECEIFICHFCSQYHRRSHATKSHALVSVSDLASSEPSAVAKRLQCKTHTEDVNLFCQTCEMTICRECAIADHREHKYSKIQEISEEEKNNLQKVLDKAKTEKAGIASGISCVQTKEEAVKAKEKSTVEEIKKLFEELAVMIEKQKQLSIERVSMLANSKLELLHQQCNRLKITLDTYEKSIDFVQNAFQCGNDVQILSLKKCISQRLNNLKCLYNQTQPCINEYMEFRNDLSVSNFEEKIVRTCAVLDEEVCPCRCSALFKETQEYLKPGKQSVVTVLCKDWCGNKLKRGGMSVTPVFSGVRVKDVTVTDNNDGSYDVSFIVLDTGYLQFTVNVCGKPASGCKIGKAVQWELNNISDVGSVNNKVGQCTMQGVRPPLCYRIGDCSFNCGIHTWVVNVSGENPYEKQNDCSTIQIGVIDDTEDISAKGTGQGGAQKWVFEGGSRLLTSVTVELDMDKKSVRCRPNVKQSYLHISTRTINATLDKCKKVRPYFAVSSPHFKLSLAARKTHTTINSNDNQAVERNAEWKISKSSGTGSVDYHGLGMTGASAPCCFWLGDCGFYSGLHTWRVEVCKGPYVYCTGSDCYIEIGVIEDPGDTPLTSVQKAKKWIFGGKAESVSGVSVKLDMTRQYLKIKASARQSGNQISPVTHSLNSSCRIFPYFCIYSYHYVLILKECRSTSF